MGYETPCNSTVANVGDIAVTPTEGANTWALR